jgi:poly(hydroxyalkanoate) depolymerase family esterase
MITKMQATMQETMQEAMRLMQQGDLLAATRALQQRLQRDDRSARGAGACRPPGAPLDLEAEYRVVSGEALDPGAEPRRTRRDDDAGTFGERRFACDAGALAYKLYVPDGLPAGTKPPLLLMLHGCTQSPDDFARGTRMDALAQRQGYVVAYPAQAQRRNAQRCWSWFRAQDQRRDRGEAALLAALAQHLVGEHDLDERRVYAAGLSAGGAMACVLANTHPDVFSAIGVHSGLPFGVAHDVPTAFAAMKKSRTSRRSPPAGTRAVPAIVFHGDADATVDPENGPAVIAQLEGLPEPAHLGEERRVTVEKGAVPGGCSYTRTVFTDAAGNVRAEQWTVHGAGHAWSGGDSAGSYTDPSGPDASAEMLRFFSASAKPRLS